jgi:rhodanese-related sulfurtransferase
MRNMTMPLQSDKSAGSLAPGEISREEIQRRLHDRSLILVDVLPREAHAAEHIPGSLNLPLAEIRERAHELFPHPAAEIAVYCAKFT